MLDRISSRIDGAARALVLLLLVLILAIVVTQITLRYAFGSSLTWSEELVRYLLVWLTFIGASVAARSGGLVGLDLLSQKAEQYGLDRPLQAVVLLLSLSFILAIGYYGWVLASSPGIVRQRFSTLPVSMTWVYACIPVSAVLTGVQLLSALLNTLFQKERAA